MPDAPPPAEVRSDTEGSRFVVEYDGVEAELLYRELAGRLILIHTGVPDALGGRGIGGQLVRASLAQARAEHLTIVPWCPFARQWLADHPDDVADAVIDWDTLPPEDGAQSDTP
jgi:predicted GNAT family acetyltransferase